MGLGLGLGLNKPKGLIYFQNQYSMEFDGVDDRIITDGADTVAQPTTYSFWCKSSTTATNRGVFGHGGTGTSAFHFNWSANRPMFYLGGSYFVFWNDTSAQDDGEWHHWVVYSEPNNLNNCKLYVDGVLQTKNNVTTSGTLNPYTEPLTIGSERQVGGNSFEGKIDEFAVFDRELTQDEITRMYNTYYTNNLIQNSSFDEIGPEKVTNRDFSQIGSEEVTNGDFSQIGSEQANYSDNNIVFNNASDSTTISLGSNSYRSEAFGNTNDARPRVQINGTDIVTGKTYKVVYTPTSFTGSTVFDFFQNSTRIINNHDASVAKTFYFVASNGVDAFDFDGSQTFRSDYTLSVKEVVGWVFESSWSIIGDKANYDAVTSQHYLKQTMSSIAAGKTVKIQFDISDVQAGKNAFFKLEISGTPETIFTYTTFTEGTYTYYHTITGGLDRLNFVPATSGTGGSFSIDNISVKEVGQDWGFIGNGIVGDGFGFFPDTTNSYIIQNTVVPNSVKQYKLQYEVLESNGGNLKLAGGSSAFGAVTLNSSVGVHTFYVSSNGSTGNLQFWNASSFIGKIDNISVQEVGQYWGFSTGWSTDGTKALFTAGGSQYAKLLQNTNAILDSKDFRVSFDLVDPNDLGVYVRLNGGGWSPQQKGTGSYTIDLSSGTGTNRLEFEIGSGYATKSLSIDNIVVQQLKHQATNLLVNSGDYQSASPLLTSTKSMEFDGVEDYLTVLDNSSLDFAAGFSVSFWVYPQAADSNDRMICKGLTGTGEWMISFGAAQAVRVYTKDGDDVVKDFTSANTLTLNEWAMVTVVVNRTTNYLQVYKNGGNLSESSASWTSGWSNSAALTMGVNSSLAGDFDGRMTEVGIWNRELTLLEVASLYNQGVPTDLLVNRNNYQSGNPTVFNTKQVDFDGVEDYLKVENAYGNFTGSLSFWYKRDDINGVQYLFDSRGDGGSGVGYALFNSSATLSPSGGTRYVNGVAGNISMAAEEWHHVVLSGIPLNINEDIKFGTRYNLDSKLDGVISQIGMWNSTLTADEVSSLYNHGLPIDLTTDQAAYESSSNLVGYWRMGDGTLDSYPVIADQTNATLGSDVIVNGDFSQIGSELLTNGDFSSGSGWNGSISVANGQGTKTGGGLAYQNGVITSGKQYKIVVDVASLDGTTNIYTGGNSSAALSVGLQTIYMTGGSSNDFLGLNNGYSTGVGSVFNSISVKEVGQDWITTNGFTIANGVASYDALTNFGTLDQTETITQGKIYKLEFTISNGTARINFTNQSSSNIFKPLGSTISNYASNTYSYYVEALTSGTSFRVLAYNNGGFLSSFSIDNISLKQVNGNPAIMTNQTSSNIENGSPYANIVQDSDFTLTGTQAQSTTGTYWNTGAGWTIANNKATSNGTIDNLDGISLETGKNYKATVTVSNMTTGNLSYRLGGASSNEILSISSNGEYTVYGVAGGTVLRLRSQNGFDGSVTNITISEVNTGLQGYWKMGDGTNDEYPVIYDQTDLTLGSELITNGDFATQTDWTFANVGFSAGAIAYDNANDNVFQSLADTVGKTYKLTITKTGAGVFRLRTGFAGSDATKVNIPESGVVYFTATSNTNRVQIYGDSNDISAILNSVSVKELQGNPATMTNMPEGNITNQYPLTKLRNYYRMGDGILDSKFTSYPATAAPFIFQDQTSPNLANIPTTNIIEYSEDFSQTYWTKISSSIGVNEIIAPDGTLTADKLKAALGGSEHKVRTSISASTNECISVFAKKGEYKYLFYRLNISGVWSNTFFDLELGTVVSTQNTKSAQIINFGNGWYRCIVSISNRTDALVQIGVSSDGNHVSTGDGTSGIYIWGAQVEAQSQATAYLKSDGIAAVRKSSTTNLIPYSEDLSQWTVVNGTITPNATVSPDGTQNADKIVFNNTGLDVKTTITVVAGERYTISFYIKLESGTGLQGRFYDNSNSTNIEYYDFTSQVQGTEWSKVTRSVTAPSGCTEMQVWLLASSSTLVTASFWGAQFEQQTQAETYAPTKGIPVTIDLFTENNYGHTQGGIIRKDVPRNS